MKEDTVESIDGAKNQETGDCESAVLLATEKMSAATIDTGRLPDTVSSWPIKITAILETKTRRETVELSVTSYFTFPITFDADKIKEAVQQKIFPNTKKKYALFANFGKKRILIDGEKCPALLQMQFSALHNHDQKNTGTAEQTDDAYYIDFEIRRYRKDERKCTCKNTTEIDLTGVFDMGVIRTALKNSAHEVVLLGSSGLAEIPTELLDPTKLRVLDMCGANLTEDSLHALYPFTWLEELCLENNSIKGIPLLLGKKLPVLRFLCIGLNELTALGEEVCAITSLEKLIMKNNKIERISPCIKNIKNLEVLHLERNLLRSLPRELSELESLKYINVKRNFISMDAIPCLPRKTTFFSIARNKAPTQSPEVVEEGLADTGAEEVAVFVETGGNDSTGRLPPDPRRQSLLGMDLVLSSLKTLVLASCKLMHIPGEIFQHTLELKILSVQKNNLSHIPKTIENLEKLVSLNAYGNNIHLLSLDFSKMRSLRILDMHSNHLKSISGTIWHCPLNTLNLSFNSIKEFPKYTKKEKKDETPAPLKREKSQEHPKIPDKTCVCFKDKPKKTGRKDAKEEMKFWEINEKASEKNIVAIFGGSYLAGSLIAGSHAAGAPPRTDCCVWSEVEKKIHVYGGVPVHYCAKSREDILEPTMKNTLRFLLLGGNLLNSQGIQSLRQMGSLVYLDLSMNDLEDTTKLFSDLRRLQYLNLSNNRLAKFPKDLKACTQLFFLHLSCNMLVSIPGEILRKMHGLKVLDLSCNDLSQKNSHIDGEWDWCQNKALRMLDLEDNTRLTAFFPAQISPKNAFLERKTQFPLQKLSLLNIKNTLIPEEALPIENKKRILRGDTPDSEKLPRPPHAFVLHTATDTVPHAAHLTFTVPHTAGHHYVFALFDGVSGNQATHMLQQFFPPMFKKHLLESINKKMEQILEIVFLRLDAVLRDALPNSNSPISLSVAVKSNNILYTANTGTGRGVLYKNESTETVSHQHFYTEAGERRRLVQFWEKTGLGRPLDPPLLTRAFGMFSEPGITPSPTIKKTVLHKDDIFLVVGTRLFWKKLSHASVLTMLQKNSVLHAGKKIRNILSNTAPFHPSAALIVDLKHTDYWAADNTRTTRRRSNSLYELNEDRSIVHLTKEVEAPTGYVAMAFVDIKNSTEYWSAHPNIMHAATTLYNDTMRRLLRKLGGYEVKKEGDSFFATFPSPRSALIWCCLSQLKILTLDLPHEIYDISGSETIYDYKGELRRTIDDLGKAEQAKSVLLQRGLSMRMSIHIARPICDFDPVTRRTDYFGKEVIKTARINSITDGGQIALSKEMYDRVCEFSHDVLEEAGRPVLFFAGKRKLKGLDKMEEIYIAYPETLAARNKYSEHPLYPALPSEYRTSRNISFEEGEEIDPKED
ncbi:MAG: adenylate cyclase [Amphiamblys sp. WSBS2006]|nr:MAG: adenylate cyclase [Amphiamblys sp. WSBS2006]